MVRYIIFLALLGISFLSATTRIMPLGDSITWDWHYGDSRTDAQRHGYRSYLWYRLQQNRFDVDFVGSRHNGDGVVPSFDGDNEGHIGWTCKQMRNYLYDYLTYAKPDIVLLHLGTNDSAYHSTDIAVADMSELLDIIDQYEANKRVKVKVIVARIIKLKKPPGPTWVPEFNQKLTTMIQARSDDDISIVDMESVLNYDDLIDGIHPTPTGFQKMADAWYKALVPLLPNYDWLVPVLTPLILSP